MCRPVRCRTCGATTWAGCGLHVAEVRAQVPPADWCPGHDDGSGTGLLTRLRSLLRGGGRSGPVSESQAQGGDPSLAED